jgi:hypothetical protein
MLETAFAPRRARLEQDGFSSNRHPALTFCLRMILSENRYTLFGIMRYSGGSDDMGEERFGTPRNPL